MSKPVKEMVRGEIKRRFTGVDSLAVVGLTGIGAVANNQMRHRLREKQIRLMVVKNSLARQAFKELGLEGASSLLEGPCALAFGADGVVSVVRELLAIRRDQLAVARNAPALVVKGAYMEGVSYGAERVEALSQYPTRPEAIARAVGMVLSPARRLAACILSPGGKLASILKTIEEKSPKEPAAGAAAPAA